MENLKQLYKVLMAARADTESILRNIDRLVTPETEEGKDKALLLDIPLSAALDKEEQALDSYIARLCKLGSGGTSQTVISRSAFNALPPGKRLEFARAGGKLID